MHYAGFRAMQDRLRVLGYPDVADRTVLDIGCGSRAPLSVLFAAAGARVTGLDVAPVSLGIRRPRMWFALWRHQGPAAMVRGVVRDVVHTSRYWWTLGQLAGTSLPFGRVKVVRGDAACLPFSDSSFDLVVSSAVWEHLADVDAATRDVGRVLTASGIAGIQIALFPALQGGHHADWHSTDVGNERTVRPWDHLRTGRLPFPLYLNGLSEAEYRRVFERHLAVLAWDDGELRGTEYLTPTLRNELANYAERDLLLSSVTVWASRPAVDREV